MAGSAIPDGRNALGCYPLLVVWANSYRVADRPKQQISAFREWPFSVDSTRLPDITEGPVGVELRLLHCTI